MGHACTNSHGSFLCTDPTKCNDTSCNSGYDCINTIDSFECKLQNCTNIECDEICDGESPCYCSVGYKHIKNKCTKINACIRNNGGCEQICSAENENVTCSCNPGFELSGNNQSCNIIQPCDEKYNKCSHLCIPLPTDKIIMTPKTAVHIAAPGIYYRCECAKGMQLNNDGYTCNDMNECKILNGGCAMFCLNTQGIIQC